jgi:hypothetical protein
MIEQSKELIEEQRYKNWIRSLQLSGAYAHSFDLMSECQSLLLLHIFDRLRPGVINWRQIEPKPNNKYKKLSNLNLLFNWMNDSQFRIVSIGSLDIIDGNQHLIFSLIWNFMRVYYIEQVTFKANCEEKEILEWAERFSQGRLTTEVCEPDEILTAEDRELYYEDCLGISAFKTWSDQASLQINISSKIEEEIIKVDVFSIELGSGDFCMTISAVVDPSNPKLGQFHSNLNPKDKISNLNSEHEKIVNISEKIDHEDSEKVDCEIEGGVYRNSEEFKRDSISQEKISPFKANENPENENTIAKKDHILSRSDNITNEPLLFKANQEPPTDHFEIINHDNPNDRFDLEVNLPADEKLESLKASYQIYTETEADFYCARFNIPLNDKYKDRLFKFVIGKRVTESEDDGGAGLSNELRSRMSLTKLAYQITIDQAENIKGDLKPTGNEGPLFVPIPDNPDIKLLVHETIKTKLRDPLPLASQTTTRDKLKFLLTDLERKTANFQ